MCLLPVALVACGSDSKSPTTPTNPSTSSTSKTTTSQPPTFTLTGLVTDRSGRPIVGARATVLDGPNVNKFGITDNSGLYTILGLSPGGFTLRGTFNGAPLFEININLTGDTKADPVTATTTTSTTSTSTTSSTTSSTTTTTAASTTTSTSTVPGSATVDFLSDSTTCSCTAGGTSGLISLKLNGSTVATMSCTQSRSLSVAPGTYTQQACDSMGCWNSRMSTLSAGSRVSYTLSCVSGSTSRPEKTVESAGK